MATSYHRVSMGDREDDREAGQYELHTLNRIPTPPAYSSGYAAIPTNTAAESAEGRDQRPESRFGIGTSRGTSSRTSTWLNRAKENSATILTWASKYTLWRYSGWQFGIRLGLCVSAFVFLGNLMFLVVGLSFPAGDGVGSIRVLHTGDCGTIKADRFWIQFMINAVATVLVGIANYTLQLLCAPSRTQVQRAHDKRRWLDIGIQSVRNLRVVGWRKCMCWAVLAVTSAVLHLTYNSVVFSTFTTYESQAMKVTDQIFRKGMRGESNIVLSWDCGYTFRKHSISDPEKYLHDKDLEFQSFMRNRTRADFERLESKECLEEYLRELTTDRDSIILVLDDKINGATYDHSGACNLRVFDETRTVQDNRSPSSEICLSAQLLGIPESSDDDCTTAKAGRYGRVWRVGIDDEQGGLLPVKYCLVGRKPRICQLNLLTPLLIATIIINFIQLAAVASALLLLSGSTSPPLITIGDAISSFLIEPDVTTLGECTMSAIDVPLHWARKRHRGFAAVDKRGSTWKDYDLRWYQSASRTRWCISYFLLFASLAIASYALSLSLNHFYTSNPSLNPTTIWDRGFGSFDRGLSTGLTYILDEYLPELEVIVANILASNTPQVLVAVLYFTFNQLFTCMLTCVEWMEFGERRKPLRVSGHKRGNQRTTPWLQLPPKWSAAVALTAFGLHFFVSQSIFLVRYSYLSLSGQERVLAGSVLGYSPVSMVFGITLGILAFLASVVIGLRVFPLGGPPLAGTSSAAISAACHLRKEEKAVGGGVEGKALMWGVVEMWTEGGGGDGGDGGEGDGMGEGHCGFSGRSVKRAVEGVSYY